MEKVLEKLNKTGSYDVRVIDAKKISNPNAECTDPDCNEPD